MEILGADGVSLGWTYDSRQYALVRQHVLTAVEALAGPDGWTLLKDIVAFVQQHLGAHEAFPSGRLTNAARYVAADLQGRKVLERAGAASPQRLRHRVGPSLD